MSLSSTSSPVSFVVVSFLLAYIFMLLMLERRGFSDLFVKWIVSNIFFIVYSGVFFYVVPFFVRCIGSSCGNFFSSYFSINVFMIVAIAVASLIFTIGVGFAGGAVEEESYNPFRMWGSYVGLGVMLVWSAWVFLMLTGLASAGIGIELSDMGFTQIVIFFPFAIGSVFFLVVSPLAKIPFLGILFSLVRLGGLFLSPVVVGFFVGWGIHSLVRVLVARRKERGVVSCGPSVRVVGN